MNEALGWSLAGLAGIGLGVFFFGGLWWTVNKSISARRPGLWVFVSLTLRMSVALTGFYLVAGVHWQRLLACLLGFLIARLMVTQLCQPAIDCDSSRTSESSHAP